MGVFLLSDSSSQKRTLKCLFLLIKKKKKKSNATSLSVSLKKRVLGGKVCFPVLL